MSVLVFGKTGQLATALQQGDAAGDITALGRDSADLSDPPACAAQIQARRPSLVINAAAFTAVDGAESQAGQAHVINADAPAAMAAACADLGIPFVHISTDYVFDGSGDTAWQPADATGPLNVYGHTKLAGEMAVRSVGGPHAILRTSWVFSAQGSNFLKTMLRVSETRDHLSVVKDQIGGPTPAHALAQAALTVGAALRDGHPSGTWHCAGAPFTSWHGFATAIFAAADRNVAVTGIPTADWPTPARRPLNSRLDCSSLRADFDLPAADWSAAVTDIVKELT
ncbi:MAG: dTDP-4-dehydrorhamnose reductase [Pseudomonadota bacterium]